MYRSLVACIRSFRVMNILLWKQGMFKSFRRRQAIDRWLQPIPWFTYPAMEYISQFDLKDKKVFEYGSGNSSLYWANRANNVISVESNPEWFSTMSSSGHPNLEIYLEQTEHRYANRISQHAAPFDIIVIDGRWRNTCAKACIGYLNEGGVIILDNSDRHYDASAYLRDQGFFQIDFSGFSPINDYTSTTSLFIRANCTLQRNFIEPDPVGGRRERASCTD